MGCLAIPLSSLCLQTLLAGHGSEVTRDRLACASLLVAQEQVVAEN